jgi:hypothetical protein
MSTTPRVDRNALVRANTSNRVRMTPSPLGSYVDLCRYFLRIDNFWDIREKSRNKVTAFSSTAAFSLNL